MNKAKFVSAVAESSDLTNTDAAKAVNAFIDTMTKTLRQGYGVVLPGFGTFTTTLRAARIGRNPQTDKSIEIAEATIPKFKAGKGLKEQVNATKS